MNNFVHFRRSTGMGSSDPYLPPESTAHLSSFGYPKPMKKLHKALRAALNRVPARDQEGALLRERILECLDRGQTDTEAFAELSQIMGIETAREDLIQKRISQMTAVDFISDSTHATPDQASVSRVRNEVLKEDRERFAKVTPKAGKSSSEWDFVDMDVEF